MTEDRRSLRALAALLPSGILGLSMSLAAADASAATSTGNAPAKGTPESVALRLEAIRNSVSVVVTVPAVEGETPDQAGPQLAWWGNGGWRNGGGWHNGGWGNGGGGWHNGGWGNGGWHNGWHNW
ncbi:MAG: GrrA/OscA1 family cyclophane-containing rSAM-modified RiPP [Reyranella sp.]|nr:GrrA/OscA1 family cyclophane-containing rSAM-modified RiPP [Reyranella sp.]